MPAERRSPPPNDIASLTVVLKGKRHLVANVASVVDALDNLVWSGVWGAILSGRSRSTPQFRARMVLRDYATHPHLAARFFPGFAESMSTRLAGKGDIFDKPPRIHLGELELDPFDLADRSVLDGIRVWAKRALSHADPKLFNELFGFAHVRRAEHKSPMLIELAIILGVSVGAPALIAYGCMKAAQLLNKTDAESDIRRTEADLKREELKQRRIQTAILEGIKQAVDEKARKGKLDISEGILVEIAKIASPSIAELSHNPLIGKITVGVSKGD